MMEGTYITFVLSEFQKGMLTYYSPTACCTHTPCQSQIIWLGYKNLEVDISSNKSHILQNVTITYSVNRTTLFST